MAFPTDAIGLRARLQVGDTWEDITPHVQMPITITRGRQAATGPVRYTTCAMKLLDPDGRYAPRNPLGRWFGRIGRNTPLEVSVLTDAHWLDIAADSDTTATAGTAVDVAGDLDVRLDVACARWGDPGGEVELIGRYAPLTEVSGWALVVGTSGGLTIGWGTGGQFAILSPSAPVPADPGERITVRVTVEVGDTGSTVTYYTGPSVDGPWTQLGDTQAGPAWAVGNPTGVPLAIGDLAVFTAVGSHRRVYAAQIRDGVDGTIVAAPDFTAAPLDAEELTDSAGVPWALSSPIGRRVRFRGVVPAWPQDRRAHARTRVSIKAAGPLRRLGQGAPTLDSALRRSIAASDHLLAYWPMEDGADTTAPYSPLPGVQPAAAAGMSFGADSTLPASLALPVVQTGATLTARIPGSSSGEWCIEFVGKIPTAPDSGSPAELLRFSTPSGLWVVKIAADTMLVELRNDGSAQQWVDSIFDGMPFGEWSRFYIEAYQDGSDVVFYYGMKVIGGDTWEGAGDFPGSVGHVIAIDTHMSDSLAGMTLGHLIVADEIDPTVYDGAETGWTGEDAMTRCQRLCTEEGVPLRLPWPSTDDVEPVGAQGTGTLLDLCQQATDADMAVLHEARHADALVYRPRYTLVNQPPAVDLDYGRGSGITQMTPVDDDQGVTNRVTVTRQGGTSAIAPREDGPLSVGAIGAYPQAVTLSLAADEQAAPQAWWRLYLGTWDGARYPVLRILLHRAPAMIPAVAALDTGDRARVDGMPVEQEPDGADLLVQGYTETLDVRTWTIDFGCTPAGPWTVGVVGDDVLGRADTDGSELAAAVGADDTTLSVAVTDGPLWTTDSSEFPFDLRLGGGEVVTATACTGSSSPQTMTVTRAVNGVRRGWDAGADVRLANPMIVSL